MGRQFPGLASGLDQRPGALEVRVSLSDLPDVLTVEEAAAVLRIGRGAAYELARRYLWSEGREGLPVIRLGRALRVPRAALERLLAAEVRPGPELRLVEEAPRPRSLRRR